MGSLFDLKCDVAFFSKEFNFKTIWSWSLRDCLEPASAATVQPGILEPDFHSNLTIWITQTT